MANNPIENNAPLTWHAANGAAAISVVINIVVSSLSAIRFTIRRLDPARRDQPDRNIRDVTNSTLGLLKMFVVVTTSSYFLTRAQQHRDDVLWSMLLLMVVIGSNSWVTYQTARNSLETPSPLLPHANAQRIYAQRINAQRIYAQRIIIEEWINAGSRRPDISVILERLNNVNTERDHTSWQDPITLTVHGNREPVVVTFHIQGDRLLFNVYLQSTIDACLSSGHHLDPIGRYPLLDHVMPLDTFLALLQNTRGTRGNG